MFYLSVGYDGEFLHVVFDPQVFLFEGLLPNNNVEIEPALRHPSGGGNRTIALRVEQQVAVRLRFSIESGRHQHRGVAKGFPLFPSRQREAECRPGANDQGGVDGQGIQKVRLDLTEHLERFDDFDGSTRRVQIEGLAQAVNGIYMHARHRGRTQVQRDTIRLPVFQG